MNQAIWFCPVLALFTLFSESGGEYRLNLTAADFIEGVDNPNFPLPAGAT